MKLSFCSASRITVFNVSRFMTMHTQAGIRLHHLNDELAIRGLALGNLGATAEQSIAGAIATGTHGTGVEWGSVSSAVSTNYLVCFKDNILSLCIYKYLYQYRAQAHMNYATFVSFPFTDNWSSNGNGSRRHCGSNSSSQSRTVLGRTCPFGRIRCSDCGASSLLPSFPIASYYS